MIKTINSGTTFAAQDVSRYNNSNLENEDRLLYNIIDIIGPSSAYAASVYNDQRDSVFRNTVERIFPYRLGPLVFGRADEAAAGVVSSLVSYCSILVARQVLVRLSVSLAYSPYGWGIAIGVGAVSAYLVYGEFRKSFAPDTGLLDLYEKTDPLILDLNHDNIIDLVSLPASSVLFDMNLDGKLESTGWVGADDGMLVLDVNGNRTIDNLSEVFSENFSSRADSGLGALALLDSNQDMVFDASDEGFGYVQVWRDLDQDGISDAGELMSLASLGVVGISLASGGVQERDGTWGYGVAA